MSVYIEYDSNKNLTKVYRTKSHRNFKALKNLNLVLPSKGLVLLCGKSGSGKTTLLNILGGLDCQTSGDIIVDGEKLEKKDLGSIGAIRAGSILVVRTNSIVMEVVEEIPEVVETEPLTQKEIEVIAGELIEANPEKQRWYGLKIHNTFALLFPGLYPTSSQTRPKLRQSSDRLEWQPQSS